jgi:Fuc2NAc and GlcNAc transferase
MLFFLLLAFSLSFFLTIFIRKYAISHQVVDVPNERSSHTLPTPRGGGVAIVVSFLLLLIAAGLAGYVDTRHWLGFCVAGALVAILGFLDDHQHVAAGWRFLGHLVGAIILLVSLGGLPPITFFGALVDLSLVGGVLACIGLVWLLNLYNFMDGIDGIASLEAVSVCVAGALIAYLAGYEQGIITPLLLAAAVTGFLLWNFPPAKIFMGDAGSGFLGLIIGGILVQAAWFSPDLFWCWLILLGVFVVDATFTLFVRLARGEKIYQAHRSHAYQSASRRYKSHKTVSLAVLGINLVWLLPIALSVVFQLLDGTLGLLIAYAPLLLLALHFRAGRKEVV